MAATVGVNIDGRRAHPLRILLALAAGSAAYALSQVLLTPALPDIGHTFHSSAVGTTSVVSVFFIAGAMTVGITGRLGDMFGKRRLLIIQLVFFSAGAVLSGFAPNLPLLLAGRALMGTGAVIFALSISIIGDELPPDRVPGATSVLSGVLGVCSTGGFLLGGVLVDTLGWRSNLWVAACIAAAGAVAVSTFVPPSRNRHPGRVDVGGAVLFSFGIGAPLVAISQAPWWGWISLRTLGLAAAGLLVLVVFTRHERRHTAPLLNLELLARPQIALTNAATALVGFALIGTSAIVSQFLQEPRSTGYGFGESAVGASFFFVPGTLLLLVTSTLAGRVTRRIGAKFTLIFGCLGGTAALTLLAAAHAHRWEVFVWLGLMYGAIGFAWATMPFLVMAAAPRARYAEATGMNFVFRNVGSGVGTQVFAALITASGKRHGLPLGRGYTTAFAVAASAAFAALLLSIRLPVRSRTMLDDAVHELPPLETGAAAISGAPVEPLADG